MAGTATPAAATTTPAATTTTPSDTKSIFVPEYISGKISELKLNGENDLQWKRIVEI